MDVLLCCGHRVPKSLDKNILFFRFEVYMYTDTHKRESSGYLHLVFLSRYST
jgi:hypothetical protein